MSEPREIVAAKAPTATSRSSRQLSALSREAKERALFSARTTEQRYVEAMQGVLEAFTSGDIGEGEARRRLLNLLDAFGYTPEDGFPDADERVPSATPNAITDLSSYGRLNLVVDTNAGMAASAARLAEETDDTLDLFPAWRLTRFMWPNGKPRDWAVRWAAAGNAVEWQGACREEMVARKDSPIWQSLGDGAGGFTDTLGNPYPPFAFNSGMGWEDVDRDEAEALGLELDAPVRLAPPSLAVGEDEADRARERFGDVFTDAMREAIAAYNEAGRCPSDGAFLPADGACRSPRHGGQDGHSQSVDYDGYRQLAHSRPDALREAERQIALIIDRRTRRQRYRGVEDLFAQAQGVSAERLAQIAEGYNDTCALHEAVAFITATPTVKDSVGRDTTFNRWLVSHYLFGDRRRDNQPKVANLRELPRAIYAIRTRPPFPKVNNRGVAQYQYSLAKPKTRAYVYCDSGVVSGWHIVYFER